jgi:hypothetical protein
MGFLFRLCFWLGVTLAIMPPDERPGGPLEGGPEGLNMEQRLTETVQSAWALVSQVSTACEQNPQLCAATAALAQTAAETGQSLVGEAKETVAQAAKPRAPAAAPIDSPVVDPNHDGRVGRGQNPAG